MVKPRYFAHPILVVLAICLQSTFIGDIATAAEPPEVDKAQLQKTVSKAISYLKTAGQDANGAFSAHTGAGVTALAATALMKNGVPATDPAVAKSLEYLESLMQADGGVYAKGSTHRNYETCLTMMCFAEANKDGRYDKQIERAEAFIKGIQWDAEEGAELSDPAYGGAGYGSHRRPDLSNTSFFVEALKTAGEDADSEAMQRALVFISRCQNLETEHNTTPFAAKIDDGGFYYTPAAGGTSQAGTTPDGGLRSYGSMTYAGLKSMIYAGVGPKDPRVKAAIDWLAQHYNLDANPGMGDNGLYYYYHTFAKALDAIGQDVFVDADGTRHNWKAELAAELASRQQGDGSWVNDNSRWLEGDQNLVTAYCLLALAYCK